MMVFMCGEAALVAGAAAVQARMPDGVDDKGPADHPSGGRSEVPYLGIVVVAGKVAVAGEGESVPPRRHGDMAVVVAFLVRV